MRIQTDVTETTPQVSVPNFYVVAVSSTMQLITPVITVTLACKDVTTISTAFDPTETETYATANADVTILFNVFIESSAALRTVDVDNVVVYTTNRPNCGLEALSVVTDATGTTPSTDVKFDTAGAELRVDATSSFYGPIFLK